ncbi:MAG: sporulation protein YunB [Clostridioides sp.]|jgi:sporulation protein YunB|nr:sporulation protein YunB [Clostridioides sp.]
MYRKNLNKLKRNRVLSNAKIEIFVKKKFPQKKLSRNNTSLIKKNLSLSKKNLNWNKKYYYVNKNNITSYKKNAVLEKKKLKKLLLFFVSIFIIVNIMVMFVYVDTRIRPMIKVLADAKALEMGDQAINEAVSSLVKGKINYEDLMNIKLDNQGKITMIQANTMSMNQIAADVALEIQKNLTKENAKTEDIPIGTVLGSPILAKYGPKLKLKIQPIGTTFVTFQTDFVASGINQTRHTIYLEANTKVKVIIPLISSDQEVKTKIPITETVLVGDVPNYYINSNDNNLENLPSFNTENIE